MARAYIIPVRSDCPGAGLQVLDLVPNTSQKNSIYDGPGQTFYIHGADAPWTTVVNGDAFVSGSRMTLMVAADDATLQDTTGGGNDCRATAAAQFGLAAYFRERIQSGGIALATAGRLSPANAQLAAYGVMAMAYAGADLDATSITAMLTAIVADTDLDGTNGFSKSFGTVEEILRIASGEVYTVPRFAIITNVVGAGEFLDLAARDVLVAAQLTSVTGKTFVSTGRFLSRGEHGFTDIPVISLAGEVFMSCGEGDLHAYAHPMTFKNPSFAYNAADLAFGKLPAVQWNGVAVPASGLALVARTYMAFGLRMA